MVTDNEGLASLSHKLMKTMFPELSLSHGMTWKFTKIIPVPKENSDESRPILVPELPKACERLMCNLISSLTSLNLQF